jgi:hypothetical protein
LLPPHLRPAARLCLSSHCHVVGGKIPRVSVELFMWESNPIRFWESDSTSENQSNKGQARVALPKEARVLLQGAHMRVICDVWRPPLQDANDEGPCDYRAANSLNGRYTHAQHDFRSMPGAPPMDWPELAPLKVPKRLTLSEAWTPPTGSLGSGRGLSRGAFGESGTSRSGLMSSAVAQSPQPQPGDHSRLSPCSDGSLLLAVNATHAANTTASSERGALPLATPSHEATNGFVLEPMPASTAHRAILLPKTGRLGSPGACNPDVTGDARETAPLVPTLPAMGDAHTDTTQERGVVPSSGCGSDALTGPTPSDPALPRAR